MNLDALTDPEKLQFNSVDRSDEYMTNFTGIIFALVFVGVLLSGLTALLNSNAFPIKQVHVEGEFRYLSPNSLQLIVLDKVIGGFFNLNVDAVRLTLLAEPWIHEVIVERVWPDALRVTVDEQVPYARWGSTGLLNIDGGYFVPAVVSIPKHLPILSGPDGAQRLLLERFNLIKQQLEGTTLKLVSASLDERRAWSFQLESGVNVILGRNDFQTRLKRFSTLVPMVIKNRVTEFESIDMRYTNGFSIKWKI